MVALPAACTPYAEQALTSSAWILEGVPSPLCAGRCWGPTAHSLLVPRLPQADLLGHKNKEWAAQGTVIWESQTLGRPPVYSGDSNDMVFFPYPDLRQS